MQLAAPSSGGRNGFRLSLLAALTTRMRNRTSAQTPHARQGRHSAAPAVSRQMRATSVIIIALGAFLTGLKSLEPLRN
jgi:hypothetical protein